MVQAGHGAGCVEDAKAMIALEPGQQWLAQFRLLHELAAGTKNRPRVWLAEKHVGSAKVVLKFLRPGAVNPLIVRRLADWRAMRVAGFMPLLGVHVHGEQMALELPYVADDNAQLRGLPFTRWSVWLEQVVTAVMALHRENFIHGDIKLSNIRRDAHQRPVIADPWLPGDGRSPYTSSPQRLAGESISVHDDLFAVGTLIHELITGYPPRYPGAPPFNGNPRLECPRDVTDTMHALMSPHPAARPSLEKVLKCLAPLNATDPQPVESSRAITLPRAAPRPAVEERQPVKPAAKRASVEPLILKPADPPVELVPIQAGAPTWIRDAQRGSASASGPSPFQSRARVWLGPLLLALIAVVAAASEWLSPQDRRELIAEARTWLLRIESIATATAERVAPTLVAAPMRAAAPAEPAPAPAAPVLGTPARAASLPAAPVPGTPVPPNPVVAVDDEPAISAKSPAPPAVDAAAAPSETFVEVALSSDGLTKIAIEGLGTLGQFNTHTVSLKPGRYLVIGSRLGYHEVRRELSVLRGESGLNLEIHCGEQI